MMTAKLCTTVADVPQDRTLLKRDAHCYKTHFFVQNHLISGIALKIAEIAPVDFKRENSTI